MVKKLESIKKTERDDFEVFLEQYFRLLSEVEDGCHYQEKSQTSHDQACDDQCSKLDIKSSMQRFSISVANDDVTSLKILTSIAESLDAG